MNAQMTTGLQPETLDEKQKFWLALAICAAVTADGNVAPEELHFIEHAVSFLDSKDQVDGLLKAVKDQNLPKLDRFPGGDRDMATKIFVELVLVVCADDILGTREIDYLLEMGKRLGFAREFTRVLIRWGSEGIVWHRKMAHLIKVGTDLEPEYG